MYRNCLLCEHRCGVDRTAGQLGFCRAGGEARVWRYWVDYAEEQPLAPSLLIYLSGCDLRCDFCISEANAFDPQRGVPLTAEWLRGVVAWGMQQDARSLQWIGGEPTIHAPAILRAMRGCQIPVPVVWKTDLYGTPEVWDLLDATVDIYLADFKFGNSVCAQRIAGVERYWDVVVRNLLDVAQRGTLMIRHLLLPGHQDCCYQPILQWLQRHLPRTALSVRTGFLPRWRADRHAELARTLSPAEGQRALELAHEHCLRLVD